MRNLVFVAFLATSALSRLDAAAYLERQDPVDVQLDQLLKAPEAYLNMRVRFRCVFVEHGDLYDPIHTQYSAESYVNVVAWDDDARIWEPQVRAKPMASLYIAKERVAKSHYSELHKYDLVEITGEVASAFRKQPWVTIHTIEPVAGSGRFSDTAVYHVEQANAMAADGARDLADNHYAAALGEKLPTNGRILVTELRARNDIAAGHSAEAGRLLAKAISWAKAEDDQAGPISAHDFAQLHYLLARTENDLASSESGDQARKERYDEAVKHASRAIELDPTQGDFYSVLGIARAGLGDFDEARKQCAMAIRMQPNNAETRLYLGRILDQQGQTDESIDALKKAIDLTPKDARMHAAIAGAYLHRGQKPGAGNGQDLSTALREYDIAIRLKPNDAELLNASGQALEVAAAAKAEVPVGNAKQPATAEMAIDRYKAAAAADPKNLQTHLALAKAYQAAGNNEAAAKHLQAATEIDPKDVKRLAEVGRFLAGMDRKEEALETFERAAKIDRKDADVWYQIGHLSLSLGNAEHAQEALEKAIDLKPHHVAALCDLVELHLAAGDAKKANKRLAVASDSVKSTEDRARVADLKAKIEAAKH